MLPSGVLTERLAFLSGMPSPFSPYFVTFTETIFMTEKIMTGSVVWLKSGGPRMTAGALNTSGFKCHWFKGQDLGEATFHVNELTLVEPDQNSRAIKVEIVAPESE
jgi:uncharacterized protein YodC (DUF2158 family)